MCPGFISILGKTLEEGGFNGLFVLGYIAVCSKVLLGVKCLQRVPVNVVSTFTRFSGKGLYFVAHGR